MRRIVLILILLLPAVCRGAATESTTSLLDRLNSALAHNDEFASMKEARIASLRGILCAPHVTDAQIYDINVSIVDEYDIYQFDSTLNYLYWNLGIGRTLDNRQMIDRALIGLGRIHATAGYYLEADSFLNVQLDTAGLDRQMLILYYQAQNRLNYEMYRYAKSPAVAGASLGKAAYYRGKLFKLLSVDSFEYRMLRVQELMERNDPERALKPALAALECAPTDSREYSSAAYALAQIYERLGDAPLRKRYLTLSALSDVHSAVKDNVALGELALMLFNEGDINTAFQFSRAAMSDAHFYNAKLRSWQVATMLPAIESAYRAKQQKQNNQIYVFMTVILVLAMMLSVIQLVQRIQNQNLDQAQRQLKAANLSLTQNNEYLQQINRQLSQLNSDIAEANGVKEEYIGLFLGVYSECIDTMQDYQRRMRKMAAHNKLSELKSELASSQLIDEEIDHFYEMFDSAFLRLYPNFVDEFNSLLVEDERIELKKDEKLNTELRIFALIRLGISDSSKIAALLRYSVNTIYNYRAKVKNKACISREEFEERIKKIGSFQSVE